MLRQALVRVAATADMIAPSGRFGRKFVGAGELETPGGRTARVVTVWVLPDGAPAPQLVGTVVFVHHAGHGYEVEFVDADGRTLAVEARMSPLQWKGWQDGRGPSI